MKIIFESFFLFFPHILKVTKLYCMCPWVSVKSFHLFVPDAKIPHQDSHVNLLTFLYVHSTYPASVPSNAFLRISAEWAKGFLVVPQIISFHRLSILGITVKTFNKTNCVSGTRPPQSHSLMVLPANCFSQLLPMDRKRSSFCICGPTAVYTLCH